MRSPTIAERTADPNSNDLPRRARVFSQTGKPFTLDVRAEKAALEQGLKPKIAQALRRFGRVTYDSWPRYLVLKPNSLDSVRQLERAYYADKLPGVAHIEIDTPSVAYHGSYRAK